MCWRVDSFFFQDGFYNGQKVEFQTQTQKCFRIFDELSMRTLFYISFSFFKYRDTIRSILLELLLVTIHNREQHGEVY